jgi:hypothetical protein
MNNSIKNHSIKSVAVFALLILNSACAINLKSAPVDAVSGETQNIDSAGAIMGVDPDLVRLSTGLTYQSGDHLCYLSNTKTNTIIDKKILTAGADASIFIEHSGFYYQSNHSTSQGLVMSVYEKDGVTPVESRLLFSAQKDENGNVIWNEKNLINCFSQDYCMPFLKKNSGGEFEAMLSKPVY